MTIKFEQLSDQTIIAMMVRWFKSLKWF